MKRPTQCHAYSPGVRRPTSATLPPTHHAVYMMLISLNECNSDTIQNCPFVVNTAIELKTIATTSYRNAIQQGLFQLTSVTVLSDVVVTFFNSIVVLTLNGSFLVVPLLHSVSDHDCHPSHSHPPATLEYGKQNQSALSEHSIMCIASVPEKRSYSEETY